MRFLICPGMARAGTTFLWEQLTKNTETFNISKTQELTYLQTRHADFEEYLECFQTRDESKIFLDVSPVYLFRGARVIENIERILGGHQVFIVLSVRSPIEQSYSLYMHQIRGHVSRLENKRSVFVSREVHDAGWVNHYLFDCNTFFESKPLQIADFVEGFIAYAGREAITFIDFHRDFGTTVPGDRLEAMLGISLKPFDYSERANQGRNQLPWYVYGGPGGATVEFNDRNFTIAPRTLVLVGGRGGTRSWQDVDPMRAAQILSSAALWTRYVSQDRVEELFDRHFKAQWQRLSKALSYDFLSAIRHKELVVNRLAPPLYLGRVPGVSQAG